MDYVISEFSEASITCACLVDLVPSVITQKTIDFSAAIEIYKGDLPTPEIIQQEILQWKVKWSSVAENERPQTYATAIKSCSSIAFPNIYILLKIACTQTVTSCECECSASVIRRLDN